MSMLEHLGRHVARLQDEEQARRPQNEQATQNFLRALRRSAAPRRTPVSRLGLALAAVIPMMVAAWFVRAHWSSLEHASSESIALGEPLLAGGQSRPLTFLDGSEAVLTAGAEVVVRELTLTGGRVDVTDGEVAFSVRHRDQTRWLIGAGPYHVRVTGTRFTIAWAPERDRFELQLQEGSVVVSAETGTHGDVIMAAPEWLIVERGQWQLGTPPPIAETPSNPPAHPASPESSSAATERRVPLVRTQARSKSWEELSRAGEYAAAYERASRRGISQLADTAPSHTLLSLADVCRFTGHGADAKQILLRLRHRFPGTDDAATAAFELGREGGGGKWFRTYLEERPNGALGREAAGRLLEELSRSGDRAAAREAARTYLERYPTGPHAAFARQLRNP